MFFFSLRIKFFFLPLQKFFLIKKLCNFLLLGQNKLKHSIGSVDNVKQLRIHRLFHCCNKLSRLNEFSDCRFAVKSSRDVDLHCVCYFLYFFYSMIINETLHRMCWISRTQCRNGSLVFGVFENQTYYSVNVANYYIYFVIIVVWPIHFMKNFYLCRWHFRITRFWFYQYRAFVLLQSLLLLRYWVDSFPVISSKSLLFFLKVKLHFTHSIFDVAMASIWNT